MQRVFVSSAVLLLSLLTACPSALSAEPLPLIDLTASASAARITTAGDATSATPSAQGLDVQINAGKSGYPGVRISPDGKSWDLSGYGHVVAKITNTSQAEFALNLRVDNAGDWRVEPWNCERLGFEPGQTREIKVIFGYQYGGKPGYQLDPAKVSGILLFTGKVKKPLGFRIDSLVPGGAPGEKPDIKAGKVAIEPKDGFLMGGADIPFDLSRQLWLNDVQAKPLERNGQQCVAVACPAKQTSSRFAIKPPMNVWDLGHTTEALVRITNTGTVPFTPTLHLTSGKNQDTTKVTATEAVAPGASAELLIPYTPERTWLGPQGDLSEHKNRRGQKGTGTEFSSHRTRALHIALEHAGGASFSVDWIKATVSTADLPDWLGKRPPVDGDWKLTLDDDFDGTEINSDVWNVTGPNWWGVKKLTHWSRDNVIVGDGLARLRFERKTGHHNDDPKNKPSPYAGGYMDSYGKWTQRYGYFECRMKLPTATALWPAFWTMPDCGVEAGEQWKRADTGKGGMEFDIMEHLTRWGPYRYTVAMHWDGYGKGHKSTGARVYFKPDAEGFVTSGLLWTPGRIVFYCQGQEVARWENERVCSIESNIIFTMPVGGWENDKHPIDAELPAEFVIDYVRVWQRADLIQE